MMQTAILGHNSKENSNNRKRKRKPFEAHKSIIQKKIAMANALALQYRVYSVQQRA